MALARYRGVAQDAAGNVIRNATVEVRRDVAGRPVVPLFSDRNGTVPLGNPITANELGQFGFHAPGGVYYIRVFTGPAQAPFQQFVDRYVAIGTAAERDVEELASMLNAGIVPFATEADMLLLVPDAEATLAAHVFADPDPTKNGDWIWIADEWVWQRGPSDTLGRLEVVAGTENDITAQVALGVNTANVVAFFIVPQETNTGPVLINDKPVLSNLGQELLPGQCSARRRPISDSDRTSNCRPFLRALRQPRLRA
jgi:hypothetical protein